MDFQKFKNRHYMKVLVSTLTVVLLISVKSFGQGCPTFQIKEVKESNSSPTGGSVVIGISSNKLYVETNFQLRQKESDVTGPVGYEVNIQVSRNELVISGLKKSDELFLKEYVVLFSDSGCDNSQIKEVGTFKIN